MTTLVALCVSVSFATEPISSGTITVRAIDHLGDRYTVVTVRLGTDVEILLYGGQIGGSTFSDAMAAIRQDHRHAVALMNGGMFGPDNGPIGLFITNGQERHSINLREGEGNFHLKPNGVFWLDQRGVARVSVSEAFVADPSTVRFATQSGPMFLIDGVVHPAFKAESTNKLVRNGVGVSADGQLVYLVISQGAVRFHDFATLFRDELNCDDALFLDATVSRLWTSGDIPTSRFGAVIAVTRR